MGDGGWGGWGGYSTSRLQALSPVRSNDFSRYPLFVVTTSVVSSLFVVTTSVVSSLKP
ncbi:MAG: hypothetical protein ACRC8Y_13610 [Chroococcales cyanobacterium]